MSDNSQKSRRNFIKKALGSAIITGVPSGIIAQPEHYIETLSSSEKFHGERPGEYSGGRNGYNGV